jgi:hypothetical protein
MYEDIRFDPNQYGYAALHHESDEYNNPKEVYRPNPKGIVDKFGLSQLDYLRDIRKALIDGIRVFPDTSEKHTEWEPNAALKNKQKLETEAYFARLAEEESQRADLESISLSGGGNRSFKDALNASDKEWEEVYERRRTYNFRDDNVLGKTFYYADKAGDKLNDFAHEILFGDEEYAKQILESIKKAGKRGKGAIDHLKDMFSDTAKAFKSYFTGQPYETSDGIRVSGSENSIFGSMKKFFTGAYDKLSKGENGEEGLLQKFSKSFMDGFEQIKVSLFGKKKLSEKAGKESSESILQKIKSRLPKAFAAGYGSALVKSVFASNLGILGNFIMPGGPLVSILTGTAFSFLKQSETFQSYMFGEKDEDGNRVGGLISKAWQDKYKENKSAIKKGAAVGILGSLFLPGGPVTGAIMGIGTSFAARNDSFQRFLYGDDYKEQDKKSLMNGTFGKVFKRLSNDNENPGLAAFLGAGGLGVGIAQGVGLLPSFLLPGGPVMGAILGLAGGITASSNKFQEFLLGEKDVDGQRYGGLLHRVTNWFDLTFTQPLKIKATEINDKIHGFLRKKLFDPIARSFEPIAYAVKNIALDIKDKVVDAFTNITSPIVESFREHVTKPLGDALKKAIVNPIKKIFGGAFKLIGKLVLDVATFPLKGINLLGAAAEGYNKRSTIKREERRRGKEYDKAHKDDGTWNKSDRKAAQKMTKEEKQKLLDEKLPYRDGKTRRQRKKEQKADYKDDMLKRKERLDEMKRQFEEDKKFAKENGFKFKSKKQKEQREQELREKEIWYQEQQLLKAQDTDEKVSKITDNVIEFPKQNEKVVDKLQDVQDAITEGFNKLMGKPSEPKEEKPSNVIPFHQGGDYGNVTDDDLNKLHEAGREPEQPTLKGQLKEAWDGFFGEVKDLKETVKKYKNDTNELKNSQGGMVDPSKISDPGLRERIEKLNKKYEGRLNGKGKVIDINKKLQDEDHSHKDGLDKVPKDGYIAELHEGEMVVPEKPAGKLRKMMNKAGKGFKGLTDVLAEVSEDDRRDRGDNALGLSDDEADRMKEIEDRERRQSIVARAKQRFDNRIDKINNWNPEDSKVMNYIAERPWLSYPTMYAARGLSKGLYGVVKGMHGVGKATGWVYNKVTGNSQDESLPENAAPKQTLSEKINNLGGMVSNSIDGVTERIVNKSNSITDNIVGAINDHTQDVEENGIISAWKHMFGKGKNEAAERRELEDDALGLTDDQEDRLKELEDRERREKVSRKGVDFVQEKIAAEERENADKQWKEKLLDAVKGIGGFAAAAGTNLFDLLGKGISSLLDGMGNVGSLLKGLALPAGILSLMLGANKHQESEEYIKAHTDANGELVTDNYDLVAGRTMVSARNQLLINPLKKIKKHLIDPVVDGAKGVGEVGKKLYDSKLGQKVLQPVVNKTKTKLNSVKEFVFGKSATKTVSKSTSNVVDFAAAKAAKESTGSVAKVADTKLMKGATEAASNSKLAKMMGKVADEGGLVGKLVNLGKQALQKIGEYAVKKFPKVSGLAKKLVGHADNIFAKMLKFSDDILKFFGKKIPAVLTKIGAGAATGFTLDVVFGVGDLISGATAGNAGNLFGVSTENVDARMRIISSVIQTVFNFNFMAIISLINEITNMMFNFNFLRNIAIWLYNLTGGKHVFTARITPEQIDSCKSIDEALQIMGITDPNEIMMLRTEDGTDWKDFSSVKVEDLGGVISAAEQIELARLQYNLANGTTLNSQAFIDMESKTLGTKFMDLFKKDSAEVKYNKLTNKAATKRDKAAKYKEKANNSNNIFGKAWNNSMAWLNEKSANRAEKKAAKVKAKAPEKRAKAEAKLAYHEEKAANATGISKWYHNWRAKANKKKVDRYTISEDGAVVAGGSSSGNVATTEETKEQVPVLSKEYIQQHYNIPEGETREDGFGNVYDHEGNLLYSPNQETSKNSGGFMSDTKGNRDASWGHAGMGDGEDVENIPVMDSAGNVVAYNQKPVDKKSKLKKAAKSSLGLMFPGAAALYAGFRAGKKIFSKKTKPEDYQMVPVMDANGNIVTYTRQLVSDTTEIKGYEKENMQVEVMGKNTQVIPQMDADGNVVSYTTVEKNSSKGKGLLSRIGSAVGSFFGLGGDSNSTSNNIDNSSSVTGDTYNTTNNEIDTTPFGPLTDAINNLVGSQGNNNIDEEGNVKTGGILKAIMDPMGYLVNKLTSVGINLYEEKTGKEVDMDKVNKGISIFNMIRNPFGYLYSIVKDKMDPDADGKKDKTFKEATKEVIDDGKEKIKQGVDWTKDKVNQGKDWVEGKYNVVKEWGKKQYNKSDDVADIIMGDNKAKANILTTGISTSADMITAIWNKFAPEEAQFAEGEVADFIATMLNKMIVKPFQELMDPVSKKWDETKEAVSTWVTEKKDAVVGWFNEKISEPFKKWYETNKEKVKKMAEDAGKWIGDKKDTIVGWYNDKIKEPFKTWASKAGKKISEMATSAGNWINDKKDKIADLFKEKIAEPFKTWASKAKGKLEEMKEGAKSWIGGMKDKIVDAFNENIKKPIGEALNPITTAVNGAWSSLKSAFEPIAGIFQAIKEKRWGDIASIVKNTGSEGRKNANADADNLRSGPKPYEYKKPIKPVQHNIDSSELLRGTTTTNNTTNNNATNKFVFYNQSDPRWSKAKIGNSSMAEAGCGPTSMAMAISQLTGEQITPDTIAKLGQEHLPGYAQYSLFPSVANKLNMNYTEGNDAGFIMRNLRNGVPVLLSGKSSASGTPYTSEGHVVTASHMKGNLVYIQDPRGDGYSKYYPINSLLTGMTKGMIITPSNATDVSGLSSGLVDGVNLDDKLGKQDLGIFGDVEDFNDLNLNMGKTGASQVTVADKVLSYARAFLANTSKFKYSQPKRAYIDNNKNYADCSSFVSHVLTVAGDAGKVAGTSTTFWNNIGSKVSSPQIGDVVCQQGHVGLYSGDGNYIHMSGRKSGIKESKAESKYNNPHRGYKRVLKNPSAMVDPTITGGNSLLGTVVATSSGQPTTGGGDTSGGTTGGGTTVAAAPAIDELGVFGKLKSLGGATLASIYNGKDMIDEYMNPSTGTVDGSTPTDGSTSTPTDGSIDFSGDTATAVWKFFTSKGYSKYATAGIMGNLQQESGMDPSRHQSGGGKGRGIAQWTVGSGRFKGLESHAKSKGKDWKDLQSQLEWIDLELGGKDSTTASILKKNYGGLSGLKNASSTKWAVEAFEKAFERAGKPMWEKRYKYADNFYSKFSSAGAGDLTLSDLTELAGMGPAMATSAQAAPADGSIPDSMNGWKYYKQGDPKWAGTVGSSTVSRGGCGPTSAAMMLSTIFGKQINPLTMTKWAHSNGTWTGAMQWSMPGKVASSFGLNMTTLGENANGVPASVLDKVKEALKSGKPVMMTGRGTGASGSNARTDTPFTPGGHVVLAVGVDGSGNIIINDPRGPGRTKAYTDTGILDVGPGLRGAWAFDTSGGKIPDGLSTDGDFTGGGSYSGTTGEGGTVAAAPSIDELGPFGKLKTLGTGIVASIFNGKDVIDDIMNPSSGTTVEGGTPSGGGTIPGASTTIDETLMFSGTEGFFKALSPAAASTYNQYKNIFPSTILAQAALESAWGKSKVAQSDKNLFGIKWTGRHNPNITVEKGRNCPGGEQGGARPYNRYKSFGDSVLDHGWFLNNNGSRYNATLNAKTPSEQITALGKSGYAESGSYGSKLQSMVNKYNLTQYNTSAAGSAGAGDGNTYLVSPKGHAGMGDGSSSKVAYSGSVATGTNTADVKAQRSLEEVKRKVNVAFNNINASDPTAYAEILKLIMEELQAINNNTAATANGVNNIEIVSGNAPISNQSTTTERYAQSKMNHRGSSSYGTKQGINTSSGYDVARRIAGYSK